MRKPNAPKKPFALSIRWQLMLFIGGITLFTLLLVWGIITYALAPQYNRNIRNKLDAKAAAITALIDQSDSAILQPKLSGPDAERGFLGRRQRDIPGQKNQCGQLLR